MSKRRMILPAWTGPGSPQSPVPVDDLHSSDGGFRYPVNREPDRRPRHGPDPDPPRCWSCGHPFDAGCECTCCYDDHSEEPGPHGN